MNVSSTKDVRSAAFQNLRSYVDEKYDGQHDDFKGMLFSIAYTAYSNEKKVRLGRVEKTREDEGKQLTSDDVKTIVAELCHEDEYEKICGIAEEELYSFGDNFSTDVVRNIAGVVVDQLKHKKTIWGFLLSSLIHALEIVIAAFMLWGIYELLVIAMPVLDETVSKYLGKIVDAVTSPDGT